MPEFLVCPVCKIALIQKGETLCCETCGSEYACDEDGYDFIGGQGSYWGEIPIEEMGETLESAKAKGWRTAARDIGSRYPGMSQYILSDARTGWLFHCLDQSRLGSCLDLGSGWGTIAFSLSRYYTEVWSVDAVKERISFQKLRAEQDGIKNIKFVRADWVRLPFSNESFDLVVANGVLEWVGLSDPERYPRDVQLDFLKEVRRVLKSGGCLYVGIENRFSIRNFLGARDHSGIPFTSLVPRKVADLMVRALRKGDYEPRKRTGGRWNSYRTYTYSSWGYGKLLREAGFGEVEAYWASSYNRPIFSGRFEDNSFPCHVSMRLLKRFPGISHLLAPLLRLLYHPSKLLFRFALPLFWMSFLFYAYKGRKAGNFERSIRDLVPERCDLLRIGGTHSVKSRECFVALKDGEPLYYLKFPRFSEGTLEVEKEESIMAKFGGIEIQKKGIGRIPVFVEPAVRGRPMSGEDLSQNLKAMSWLLEFQKKTEEGIWSLREWEEKVKRLEGLLPQLDIFPDTRLKVRSSLEEFLLSLSNLEIPILSEHGDFCAQNILVQKDGSLFVMDWEFFQEKGDPFFDLLFFLLSSHGLPWSKNVQTLVLEFSSRRNMPPEIFYKALSYVILRCIHRTAYGEENRHLNYPVYINLLKEL